MGIIGRKLNYNGGTNKGVSEIYYEVQRKT